MAITRKPREINIHEILYFVRLILLIATIAPANWSTMANIKAKKVIIPGKMNVLNPTISFLGYFVDINKVHTIVVAFWAFLVANL